MLAIFKVISLLPFCIVILFFAFDFGGQICVDGKNEDLGYPGGIQGQLCANVECSMDTYYEVLEVLGFCGFN